MPKPSSTSLQKTLPCPAWTGWPSALWPFHESGSASVCCMRRWKPLDGYFTNILWLAGAGRLLLCRMSSRCDFTFVPATSSNLLDNVSAFGLQNERQAVTAPCDSAITNTRLGSSVPDGSVVTAVMQRRFSPCLSTQTDCRCRSGRDNR